jgi:uncharacterized protein (DUF305 family)
MELRLIRTHHQAAVALAETESAEGKHPAAIQLAETIAKRQQQEIETMQELPTKPLTAVFRDQPPRTFIADWRTA